MFTAFAAPGPASSLIVGELQGNPAVGSERVLAYEAGYRLNPRARVSFDFTGFYNVYRGIVTLRDEAPFARPGPPPTTVVPSVVENALEPILYGAEAAVAWRLSRTTDLRVSYTYFAGGQENTTDVPGPSHQLHTRWFWRPHPKLEWDSGHSFTDDFSGVAAHHRVDSRLGWLLSPQWDFSVTAQDVFGSPHRQAPPVFSLTTEIGRSVHGKLTWRH